MPELLFNCDETMLAPGKERLKILTRRGDPVPCVSEGPTGEHVTLLLGVSASGDSLPPVVIFPLITVPPLDAEIVSKFAIAGQKSGWMDQDIFRNIIFNIYVPEIQKRRQALDKLQAMAVIVYDGSSTHFGIDLVHLYNEHNILLWLLPPHTSAILQPLDLSVNGQLKKFLGANFKPIQGESATDRRNRLLMMTKHGLDDAQRSFVIQRGWRRTGLWPVEPEEALGSDMIDHDPERMPAPDAKKPKRGPRMVDGNVFFDGQMMPSPPKIAPLEKENEIVEAEPILQF